MTTPANIQDVIDACNAISDPIERALHAATIRDSLSPAMHAMVTIREDAVLEALDTMDVEQIADRLSLSPHIVSGMVKMAAHRAHAARLGLPDNR